MPAEDFVLGIDAKAYLGAVGSPLSATNLPAANTWFEFPNVQDLDLDLNHAEADITTRGGNGFENVAPTLRKASITFQILWRPGDAQFDKLWSAFKLRKRMPMAFMDKDIATPGAEGLAGNMSIMSFKKGEKKDGVQMGDVTVRPGGWTDWYTAA